MCTRDKWLIEIQIYTYAWTGCLRVDFDDLAKWVFIAASYELQHWHFYDLPPPELYNFGNIGNHIRSVHQLSQSH